MQARLDSYGIPRRRLPSDRFRSPSRNSWSARPPAGLSMNAFCPSSGTASAMPAFPRELIPEMAALGFLGANIEGYGCAGMSNVEYGLIMQEIERGDSGLRSFVSVQGALVMYPILQYGSEEQKSRWLPRCSPAKAIGCFGLTEPDFGSNPAAMRTRAVRDGSRLGAQRRENLDHQRFDRGCRRSLGQNRRTAFAASSSNEARPASPHPKFTANGPMRASVTSSLSFTDCRVPESAMLPGAKGLQSPAGLPFPGALRHRLGRHRRGHGLLRNRPRLRHHCANSSTTSRSPATNWCRKNSPG